MAPDGDPFNLDETGDSVGKLASSLNTMQARQPNGPLDAYTGPVNEVVDVIRTGSPPRAEVEKPQAASITPGTLSSKLSDLKAGTFKKAGDKVQSQNPVLADANTPPESEDNSSFRPGG